MIREAAKGGDPLEAPPYYFLSLYPQHSKISMVVFGRLVGSSPSGSKQTLWSECDQNNIKLLGSKYMFLSRKRTDAWLGVYKENKEKYLFPWVSDDGGKTRVALTLDSASWKVPRAMET